MHINLNNFVGKYLPANIADTFNTLNGACVATWLRGQGYDVVRNRDTGRNGEAVTTCGFVVSTNGYVYTVK